MLAQAEGTPKNLTALKDLDDLVALVMRRPEIYVRYSRGPESDIEEKSRDYESGLDLPGLSANPLAPPTWWSRPLEDWLARRLCSYVHLRDESNDARVAWILAGTIVERGPDNEPLLNDVEPIAMLSDSILDEALHHYESHFDVGRDSRS
jgi:Family of unknown function (DUF6098)